MKIGLIDVDGHNAPKEIKWLQRWCNNKKVFKTCHDFKDYNGR